MNNTTEPFVGSATRHNGHCTTRRQSVIAVLCELVSPEFDGLDLIDAYTLAENMLTERTGLVYEDSSNPDELTQIQKSTLTFACDRLACCVERRCRCAETGFTNELGALDRQLARLGAHLWVVTDDAGVTTMTTGTLTASYMWYHGRGPEHVGDALNTVTVDYDGTYIKFSYHGQYAGQTQCAQYTLEALPDVYYTALMVLNVRPSGLHDSLLTISQDILDITTSLYASALVLTVDEWPWPVEGYGDDPSSFEDLVAVAYKLGVDKLDEPAMCAARALAVNWNSTFTELLAAARASCVGVTTA